MSDSRRLDGRAPSLAGLYVRKLCTQCGGQGCLLCNEGYTWLSTYAPRGGEQGDDFRDISHEWVRWNLADELDEKMEARHA